jgi:CHAT domain-containing protein
LLVVNPTQDLPGAELEGQRVEKLLKEGLHTRLTVRQGADATRAVLRGEFRSGKYDLVHYAGHAFFDAAEPSRSGILCAGREVLSGAELSGLGNPEGGGSPRRWASLAPAPEMSR